MAGVDGPGAASGAVAGMGIFQSSPLWPWIFPSPARRTTLRYSNLCPQRRKRKGAGAVSLTNG